MSFLQTSVDLVRIIRLIVVLLSPHKTIKILVALERGTPLPILLNFLSLLDDFVLLQLNRGQFTFGNGCDAVVQILPNLMVDSEEMLLHGFEVLNDPLLRRHHRLLHNTVHENPILSLFVLLNGIVADVTFQ